MLLADTGTNAQLIGIMATLITALAGSLGYLIKAMSDRIDRKDEELNKARVEGTEALTKSSEVLRQVIEYLDRLDRDKPKPRAPAKSRST